MAAMCGICGLIIGEKDGEDKEGILRCASDPDHSLPVHYKCILNYVDKEATMVVKSKVMHCVSPRLPGGGGSSTKVIAKSLQKRVSR